MLITRDLVPLAGSLAGFSHRPHEGEGDERIPVVPNVWLAA